ncbi:MAG: GDP-mannose 4,6-dehydratase [marine benthic group bacterium]|nr:GDP-mannose 4,6-dehydratase [Gemmatimonadota bacterium]
MKVLVTGADGFVGEHLVAELLSHGYEVNGSTLTLPPVRDTLTPEEAASVDWKAADVRDHGALVRLVAAVRPEMIFHLSGFASGSRARENAALSLNVNAGGTVNLCEAVLAVREDAPDFDPRILVMGSGDAYGDAASEGSPLTEEMHLRPVSPYGLSKAAQELAAHTYRRAHELRILVTRSFNLVGPGQGSDFVVPDFCGQVSAIASGERPPVMKVGNLDVSRDFTDVRDGVRALREVMELDRPEAAYNVASGEAVSIRQILDWILDEAGVDPEIRVDPARVRPGEIETIRGDASRLSETTGWRPQFPIEDAVRGVYRWTARRWERGGGTTADEGYVS